MSGKNGVQQTGATSAMSAPFERNLAIGSAGSDVQSLQEYLNSHGYVVATSGPGSPAHETTTLGAKTWQALMKFQKANGIVPATGYFGPRTRAFIAGH